ncbi:MAG TPA: DinB family protein [Bryobacteraceae bacterium]|nr:DinB family protein [Bryobacteraceae bacterium]
MSFTKSAVRSLHTWTHERFEALLDHAATLPPELLTREVAGFGKACLRDQLVHMLASESTWIRGLEMLPRLAWRGSDYPTVEAIRGARREVQAATQAYIDRLDEAELNREIGQLPANWVGPPRSPAFIIVHVTTHAFHHKGQVVAMFRLLGYPAPDTDLQRAE